MTIFLNTDGASRGNPGPAAVGGVVSSDKDEVLFEFSERITHLFTYLLSHLLTH